MEINTPLISKYIRSHNLSVESFAKRAGLKAPTLWRILHVQTSFRTDNLLKIIKAMGLSKRDLSKIFIYDNSYKNVERDDTK